MSEIYDWSMLFKGSIGLILSSESEWKNFYDPAKNVKRLIIDGPNGVIYTVNISIAGDEYGKFYLEAKVETTFNKEISDMNHKDFSINGLFSTKTEYPPFNTRTAAKEHIEFRWIPSIAKRKS